MYCSHCEKDMPDDFKFCPVCGSPPPAPISPPPPQFNPPQQPNPPNYNPYPPQQPNPQSYVGYKSEGTALVLAIVLGLFGLCGIGQMYAGRIGRGVGILFGVWILYGIGVATLYILIGIAFLIGGLILFIWQIFDARNLCKQYNDYLLNNGRPPW